MQDIRLIGLDLDGTVFDDAKHISPRNLAAIEAAVQAGIIVLPATGRTATGVPQAFTGIPGVYVPLKETLRGFAAIVDGEMDQYPEAAFYNVGTLDDVIAKAKKIEEGEV